MALIQVLLVAQRLHLLVAVLEAHNQVKMAGVVALGAVAITHQAPQGRVHLVKVITGA